MEEGEGILQDDELGIGLFSVFYLWVKILIGIDASKRFNSVSFAIYEKFKETVSVAVKMLVG